MLVASPLLTAIQKSSAQNGVFLTPWLFLQKDAASSELYLVLVATTPLLPQRRCRLACGDGIGLVGNAGIHVAFELVHMCTMINPCVHVKM